MTPETEEIIEASDTAAPVNEVAAEENLKSAENINTDTSTAQPIEAVDYGALLKSDMSELSEEFSPGDTIKITDLKNPVRYGALRDLGLTPREAYLASGGRKEKADNRSHLSSSVPRVQSAAFSEMPRAELDTARELFADMSDSEIRNLYRKVTK